ncbi:hypothetical protein OQJ68_16485 [Microbulbifer thermotolerans]|uniref:Uncharacterized protein n=1 Tax=Microbulbifer thermotolerans TaxID=252514 RepID=A0AB35I308_MICTH|nr:hypothetical protein [Microbulbifer thermotolerans]MCX2803376.1 hypothetical protein [Microbulbifer thermotolerans]
MQVEARFRRRAKSEESISELNNSLLKKLSKIKELWAESKSVEDVYFDVGIGESAASDLSPCLIDSVNGAISFASRLPAAIADKATSDDTIILKFDSDEIDFHKFCNDVFPEIIEAFNPYRAVIITDLDQDLDDFEDIVQESQSTGKDIDGRDSVFRIYAINYFDDEMCKRAFGIGASEVVEKLKSSIERAEEIAGGALLLVSSEPVAGSKLASIDGLVRRCLSQTA